MQSTPTGLRLALVAGVLAGLTACTTTPIPIASLPTAPVAGALPTPLASARSDLAVTPPDEPAGPLAVEPGSQPRPALLAGEPAREFQRGGASWYGPGFHGRRTASGERYDMHAFTAAHRTLPFGTWVRVHSLVNGREVDVRITDRGPFIRSRVIDVSRGAAEALGMLGLGFKEVVLLVPESLPVSAADVVDLPSLKGRGVVRRVLKARD